jgi:hypothetical protein
LDTPRITSVFYRDYERGLNVSAVADRILFTGDGSYGGTLIFLSILGAHSAVRGVLAAAVTRHELRATDWPAARFYGVEGARIVTQALTKSVTHGVYLDPDLLLGSDSDAVAVLDPTPERLFARLNHRHALPALPKWAPWIRQALESKRYLVPLTGFGVTGCRITATEEQLDAVISAGVRDGSLSFS